MDLGLSAVFFFLRYAIKEIPRPVAWLGVSVGILCIAASVIWQVTATRVAAAEPVAPQSGTPVPAGPTTALTIRNLAGTGGSLDMQDVKIDGFERGVYSEASDNHLKDVRIERDQR